jgi:hypothetical protein
MQTVVPSRNVTRWRFEEGASVVILGVIAAVALLMCTLTGHLADFAIVSVAGWLGFRLRYLRRKPSAPQQLPPGTAVDSRSATVIVSVVSCAPFVILVFGGFFADVMFAVGGGLALGQLVIYARNLKRLLSFERASGVTVYRMHATRWLAIALTPGIRLFIVEPALTLSDTDA